MMVHGVSGTSGAGLAAPGDVGTGELAVDLAGDVALEDTDDLFGGASLLVAPLDVEPGAGVGAHAGDDDAPEGVVGLAVAAPIQPVTDNLAAGGFYGGHPAQVGPGGLGAKPLGVVAGGG